MPLPTPPKADNTATATAAAPASAPAASETATEKKAIIKQFGKSKDENGNVIHAPKPLGVDLVALSTTLWEAVKAELAKANIDAQAFADACKLDKPNVPGSKEGRITYGTANFVVALSKMNGLLTKVRGATGGAVMKAKIEEKDNKIKALEAQLAELMAKLGGAK